jgi:uncharacterized protein DUF4054
MSTTVDPPVAVVFDYQGWMAAYPEFAAVTQPRAQRFFNEACVYCDNTACSPIADLTQREIYLWMLTAHIAALNGGLDPCGEIPAGQGRGLVGRITNASEGSVSVGTEYPVSGDGPNAAWYNQTPYGANYWVATAQFRTFQYHLGPQPFPEPFILYGSRFGIWRA